MNEDQKSRIAELRKTGHGYKRIGKMLGLSENTVKSYCRRTGLGGIARGNPYATGLRCRNCGEPIVQVPGRKPRKFCSDACRNAWWNSHPELVNRKAFYQFTCAHCGKPFTAYGNAGRKYCSHGCYIEDRFGGGRNG